MILLLFFYKKTFINHILSTVHNTQLVQFTIHIPIVSSHNCHRAVETFLYVHNQSIEPLRFAHVRGDAYWSWLVRNHKGEDAALSSLGGVGGVVRRLPVPVREPHGIGGHRGAVLVAVPGVVRVRPVLDVQDGVPEARLPEGRVPWLRLRHAAVFREQSQKQIFGQEMVKCAGRWTSRTRIGAGLVSAYLVASPSWFPPSPIVM